MLRSNFELDYPDYEILFCVQRAEDPVIPLVRRLIAEYPSRDAKLLIGDDPFSANPKLNNCLKGWENSRHELVIMADSNVLMPRDYIQVLLKHFGPDIAVTFSPPIGTRPESFWADVECAFLNSFQARVLYAGDVLRLKPIQGKSMLLRRSWLEARGGIRGLSAELAEDIALRKMILRSRSQTRIGVDTPLCTDPGPTDLRRSHSAPAQVGPAAAPRGTAALCAGTDAWRGHADGLCRACGHGLA